ncbi:hypothetical protein TREPR_2106 [Treponema primitia ZAS-2]|uniref:Uncharacterized protein n=1 Tax=Treponema primitia (strain ATCC BAA-887 / DSM 12427 / ZAS-2) TaxID=545694 RepID=F5YJ84_TREPZ|nr:hypothetical protein [Treponema primitia]AEF86794.1 hypothetical protein TREPR_2106 [Treponema primitia ZAS-2]
MDYTEDTILRGVKRVLAGAVNELLDEEQDNIPRIEFPGPVDGYLALSRLSGSVCPDISLLGGERTEKDRIIGLEVFDLAITFFVPELDGEQNCYAYAAAVTGALEDDPTLGGVADRAVVVKKKYTPPRTGIFVDGWEAVLTVRVFVEK